jgi:glycosyltransferase involved in cell wall biosynthesis
MRYYVITPAKNEEKFITFTLESMVKQLLKPVKWIIVDDGSTDKTKEIVEKYQKEHNWIEIVTIDNKQEQKLYGSKVIRAFNAGFKLVKDEPYDYIVKLDADLSFPPEYFKDIATAFANNNKLGICGGFIVEKESDFITKSSRYPRVQGAVKAVRAQCFKDIDGFMEANGWDGLDLLKALYLGWEVGNVPLKVIHHRIEGTEYRSLKFFQSNGYTHYMQGNDLFLTFVRGVFMLREKPYVLVSLSYVKGYFQGMFSKEPKYVDKGLAKFIRKYHYKRLLNFKR